MNDDGDSGRPSEERVIARAWVLSCVACRAYLEDMEPQMAKSLHRDITDWIDDAGFASEFETSELQMVLAKHGTLTRQQVVNGTWRTEGLAVLAWALDAIDFPPHDVCVDPQGTANSVFFLAPQARQRAEKLNLRYFRELSNEGERQLAIHWRLREFSRAPAGMDLVEFAEKVGGQAWCGAFDLSGIPLQDRDLAIGGLPIAQAALEEFRRCSNIASERHHAINWLLGWNPVYSEVDTST